jgi:hypothetical protein
VDRFGVVGTAGDVNGDGFADVLIGAQHHGDGRTYVYAGRRIFLDASRRLVMWPVPLTVTTGEGPPNAPTALFAVEVNGSPATLLIATGRLDANGAWQLATETPAGLSGLKLTLRSFVLDPAAHVVIVTNDEKVSFL